MIFLMGFSSSEFVLLCSRVYGGYDFKSGICVPEHILKERDEGEVCWGNELLCLSFHVVSLDSHTFRHCCGRAPDVGGWLAKSYLSDWTKFHMVNTMTCNSHQITTLFYL